MWGRKKKKERELFTFLKDIGEEYAEYAKFVEGKQAGFLKPREIILDLTVEEILQADIEGRMVVVKAGGLWEKRNVHAIKIILVPKEK
jgi:hypothetical protein